MKVLIKRILAEIIRSIFVPVLFLIPVIMIIGNNMYYKFKYSFLKILFLTSVLLVLFYPSSYGQMSKFPLQDKNTNYKATSIITAPNNDLLFFWVSDLNLYQSRSTNNGQTWSDPILLGVYYQNYYVHAGEYLSAITSISGRIIIIFYDYRYYSMYSDDNGNSWSSPLHFNLLSSPLNGVLSESLTGKLFYTYTKVNNTVNAIYFITSTDGALSWSGENNFPTTSLYGSVTPIDTNKLLMVCQNQGIYYSISTNDGVNWGLPITIVSKDTSVNIPRIIKDQSGKLWLFYQRYFSTPFPGTAQQDIVYRTSVDSAVTWSSESNFTTYKGPDNFYHVSIKGNNPLVSFTSDRGDSLKANYSIWYGTAGVTQDASAPPYIYKTGVSVISPLPHQQFNIDAYVDGAANISSVILNRYLNCAVQPLITMYDDGTHGDTTANDKIYTCQVPGISTGDGLQTSVLITDQNFNAEIYSGPFVKIPFSNSLDSVMIDVNRFKLPINNIGFLADQLISGQSIAGGKYDGGIVLYSGGFYMAGKSNGFLWGNGSFTTSRAEDYVPGKVGSFPQDPNNRLYIVRTGDPPFSQSWQDWKYAVSQGADFYDGDHDGIYNPNDLNGNGIWDPDEDRPDFLGDITVWCVYNDGLPSNQRIYNDVINPQGIEIQQSVFAQKDSADLNSVIFVRYRLINTGTVADVMDSVYFGAAADVDVGDNGSMDLVGCDTLLNSGYIYHSPTNISTKWGYNPPAELVTQLQGPVTYIPGVTFTDVNSNGIFDPGVDTPIDTAYSLRGPLLGKIIYPGAKNLNITSSFQYYGGIDPADRFQVWDYLRGRDNKGSLINVCDWARGNVLGGVKCANVNPVFMYSGNPFNQTGWLNNTPEDQRIIVSSGPFKLEKNKPNDIIFAHIVGRGNDAMNSLFISENYASDIIKYYNSNFPNSIVTGIKDSPNIVNNFRLDQNYPNPFNPSTKIRYSVRTNSLVTIKVYNILGKEVAVLLNENKNPGEYTVDFNAGKFNLASGVYFYRLTSGSFNSVKKMVLLK